MDKKILIIVILVVVIAVISSAFITTVLLTENNDPIIIPNNDTHDNGNQATNTKSWHLVSTYSGVGDDVITINANENNMKVVSTAMPLKNYGENYMITSVDNAGSSELSWNEKSAVATKSTNIQFTGQGSYNIYVSTYELDYWNIEIYEWY